MWSFTATCDVMLLCRDRLCHESMIFQHELASGDISCCFRANLQICMHSRLYIINQNNMLKEELIVLGFQVLSHFSACIKGFHYIFMADRGYRSTDPAHNIFAFIAQITKVQIS